MKRIKCGAAAAAAAAACALASGNAAAQTNVRAYGILDVFASSYQVSGTQRAAVIDSGGMTTSYWGLAGTEDLGGGLKTTFAIESYVRVDTGSAGRSDTDPLFARSAYVGLAGSFGEIRLGRQINPLFSATVLFEPTGGSTRFSPLLNQLWTVFGRVVSGDTTRPNAIGYYSPTIGGFSGRVVYSLGEAAGTNGINNASGMLLYQNGPFGATVAAQKTKFGPGITAANPEETVYVLGTSYDVKVAKLFAQYDRKRASGVTIDQDVYSLGAAIPVGPGNILTSFARTKTSAQGTPDYHRNSALLGYDYALSKRTDIYANYLYDKLSTASSGNSFGVGVRHSF